MQSKLNPILKMAICYVVNQPVQSSSFDQGHNAIWELSSFHRPEDEKNN